MYQSLVDTWGTHWEPFDVHDVKAFKRLIANKLKARLAKDPRHATTYDRFLCLAYAVSDHLVERWVSTQELYHRENPKRVYYLSMEFLLGRTLENALLNLGLYDTAKQAMSELGVELADLLEEEADPGLGNGGLGRLAACFMDSLATLGIPAHGYGLRYEYGLFEQKIEHGRQVEAPDHWLAMPNPWEVSRPELTYPVRFGGRTAHAGNSDSAEWLDTDSVIASPCDTPIPGYDTETTNTLRLWTARATKGFDFACFDSGDHLAACVQDTRAENITRVLYPNENCGVGRELRLQQEYFLVSASIQDIAARFKRHNDDWRDLPDKAAIQLNDTHPALAIPELLRILLDEEGLNWETAWEVCVRTFGYTNHTILPEALEEWPVELLQRLLPRHLEIIYLINHHFLKDIARRFPGDIERLRRMSIIAEDGVKRVRMAYLAVVASHKVNGVAELHTRLLTEVLFPDFYDVWPERFTNKTNGITPRRWLRKANPGLSGLITEAIGDAWVKDLSRLRELEAFADDPAFQERWRAVKQANKLPILREVEATQGLILRPDSIFDVQVKRIHEYKRQTLFGLYMIASYLRLKEDPAHPPVPRTFLVGGKAAPGYYMAKLVIHFINRIADMVNRDPATRDLIRVSFLPNYRVSLAEKLIPAADLSEQISTAGREASGTGNMKFALNGALTIGTLDGANIEIMQEVGPENIFIFGHTADEVMAMRREGYDPTKFIAESPMLAQVLRLMACDFFSPGEPGLFKPLYDALVCWDEYFLMADFDQYVAVQDWVSETFLDPTGWTSKSIMNVARCGKFSSDRTILDYAGDIWDVQGLAVSPRDATDLQRGLGVGTN
ncbi:MAG: glycogen/starch/alpha-glucan phosphorylase [Armatimonadota bacterium]